MEVLPRPDYIEVLDERNVLQRCSFESVKEFFVGSTSLLNVGQGFHVQCVLRFGGVNGPVIERQ